MKQQIKRINGKVETTQYTSEEIEAARIEWNNAREQLDNALDAATEYMHSNGYERMPNFFVPFENDAKGQAIQDFIINMSNRGDDHEINPLRQTVTREFDGQTYEVPIKHRYTNESQPVGKARKQAATLRNCAKKLNVLLQ